MLGESLRGLSSSAPESLFVPTRDNRPWAPPIPYYLTWDLLSHGQGRHFGALSLPWTPRVEVARATAMLASKGLDYMASMISVVSSA